MATRPSYSFAGFLRRAQISNDNLWILQEDSRDHVFTDGLAQATLDESVDFIVTDPSKVLGMTGGKSALLQLYDYLRKRKLFVSSLGKSKTVICFFLDKDLDDLEGCQRRLDFAMYTEHYCVENYLFRHGDVRRAAMIAAGMPAQAATAKYSDSEATCQRLSLSICEWVAICLLVRRLRLRHGNYGVSRSPIHNRPPQTVDNNKLGHILRSIANDAKIGETVCKQRHSRLVSDIKREIRDGTHDRVFNGKWYFYLLYEEACHIQGKNARLSRASEAAIRATLLSTLDFSDAWAAALRRQLVAVRAYL